MTSWTSSATRVDVDVELHIELRLHLPLIDLGRARILDRQILDILGEGRDLRARSLSARAIAGVRVGSWSAMFVSLRIVLDSRRSRLEPRRVARGGD